MSENGTIYKIHPSIGVARVGTSNEYYLAPEQAGALPELPDGRPFSPRDFRDGNRLLRRQGARFAVYRYTEAGPTGGEEVRPGTDGVARIEWTVHLANKKASWYQFLVNAGSAGYTSDHPLRNASVTSSAERRRLIIDPGPRTLTGPDRQATFSRDDRTGYPMTFPPERLKPFGIDSLGEMLTDANGRLTVLGGYGHSGSSAAVPAIGDYANNDEWWDDTADGPVTACVVMEDGERVEVDASSWVVVGPPRFAPQLVNLVTLYDTIFDTAVRFLAARPDIYASELWNRDYRPSWAGEIEPVLQRVHHYHWVTAVPPHPHDFDMAKLGDPDPAYDGLRSFYFHLIRSPENPNTFSAPAYGMPMMPYLCGDNCFMPGPLTSTYATVTPTQYFLLSQWASGRFNTSRPVPLMGGPALDRGALDNCVGGAFSPGIEVTWISRDPRIFEEPLRIRRKRNVVPPLSLGQDFAAGLEPGDLCKYMALPWQADFNECSGEIAGDRFLWWWPVQRPDYVFVRQEDRLHQVPWVGSDADQNASDYCEFSEDIEMVRRWSEQGFVFDEGPPGHPEFVEVERLHPRHGPGG